MDRIKNKIFREIFKMKPMLNRGYQKTHQPMKSLQHDFKDPTKEEDRVELG